MRTLEDLLCIIHRDGGHYIAEYGIEKAYDDALMKHYEQRSSLEREKVLEEALEYYANAENWKDIETKPNHVNGLMESEWESPDAWGDEGTIAREALARVKAMREGK